MGSIEMDTVISCLYAMRKIKFADEEAPRKAYATLRGYVMGLIRDPRTDDDWLITLLYKLMDK